MARPSPSFRLDILTDGNVILRERLTRSLRSELRAVSGVDVEFVLPPQTVFDGSKSGAAIGEAALWVFLTAATRSTARVLIEAIKAWSARERNRTVRITSGDRTIEIPGSPDEVQERITAEFLEGGRS